MAPDALSFPREELGPQKGHGEQWRAQRGMEKDYSPIYFAQGLLGLLVTETALNSENTAPSLDPQV